MITYVIFWFKKICQIPAKIPYICMIDSSIIYYIRNIIKSSHIFLSAAMTVAFALLLPLFCPRTPAMSIRFNI